jgi:hypothetical protein
MTNFQALALLLVLMGGFFVVLQSPRLQCSTDLSFGATKPNGFAPTGSAVLLLAYSGVLSACSRGQRRLLYSSGIQVIPEKSWVSSEGTKD